jgi:hypothetical protein
MAEHLENEIIEIKNSDDVRMVDGLPLVVVIERDGRKSIHRITNLRGYWGEIPGSEYLGHIDLEKAETLCTKYGVPVPEERFKKASVFPAIIKHTPNGSYIEYRTKFE